MPIIPFIRNREIQVELNIRNIWLFCKKVKKKKNTAELDFPPSRRNKN
jgi:hypothetical protein